MDALQQQGIEGPGVGVGRGGGRLTAESRPAKPPPSVKLKLDEPVFKCWRLVGENYLEMPKDYLKDKRVVAVYSIAQAGYEGHRRIEVAG